MCCLSIEASGIVMTEVIVGVDTWFCLDCVDVLFIGFCCSLWFLEKCDHCVLPVRRYFLRLVGGNQD